MRQRLKFISSARDWRARFKAVAERYAEYVGPAFYDLKTGEEWAGFPKRDDPALMLGNEPIYKPMYIPDVPDHVSPITGRHIGSMSAMRDEFKRTGARPWDEDSKNPKGYTDPAFCARRGLKVSDKARAHLDSENQKIADALDGRPHLAKKPRVKPEQFSREVRNQIVSVLDANGITD